MTPDDWVKIIGALATAVALVLGAIGALWRTVHQYRREINGRMDEFLALTRESAEARGRLAAKRDPGRLQSGGPSPSA